MIGLRSYTKHLQTTSAMAFVGMIIYHVCKKRGGAVGSAFACPCVFHNSIFQHPLGAKMAKRWYNRTEANRKEASAICKGILVYEKNVSVGVTLLWVGILALIHKSCDPGPMTQSRFSSSVEPEIIIPLQKDDVNIKSGNACWERIVWGNVRKYSQTSGFLLSIESALCLRSTADAGKHKWLCSLNPSPPHPTSPRCPGIQDNPQRFAQQPPLLRFTWRGNCNLQELRFR